MSFHRFTGYGRIWKFTGDNASEIAALFGGQTVPSNDPAWSFMTVEVQAEDPIAKTATLKVFDESNPPVNPTEYRHLTEEECWMQFQVGETVSPAMNTEAFEKFAILLD